MSNMKVLFVAGFGPVTKEPKKTKSFYVDTLGLPMEQRPDNPDYYHTEKLAGVRHFATWPLNEAATPMTPNNMLSGAGKRSLPRVRSNYS